MQGNKELRECDGKIVECKWDAKRNQWKFLRIRTDRSFPNAFTTAQSECLAAPSEALQLPSVYCHLETYAGMTMLTVPLWNLWMCCSLILHLRAHTHAHMHAHTRARTHTHTHTHTHTRVYLPVNPSCTLHRCLSLHPRTCYH